MNEKLSEGPSSQENEKIWCWHLMFFFKFHRIKFVDLDI